MHAHARGALHERLDDHGADFVGVVGERSFHGLECAARACLVRLARLARRYASGVGTVITSISSGW